MATYGLLNENNVIENIIKLHPINTNEFSSAVPRVMSQRVLRDEYRNRNFYCGDE